MTFAMIIHVHAPFADRIDKKQQRVKEDQKETERMVKGWGLEGMGVMGMGERGGTRGVWGREGTRGVWGEGTRGYGGERGD